MAWVTGSGRVLVGGGRRAGCGRVGSVRRGRVACMVKRVEAETASVVAADEKAENGVENGGKVEAVNGKHEEKELPEVVKQDEDGMATLEMLGMKVRLPGKLLILVVPFLWGSFGPAVRFLYGVEHAPRPSLFNAERLSLSAMVYGVVLWYQLVGKAPDEKEKDASQTGNQVEGEAENKESFFSKNKGWILGGLELGSYVFLANVTQVLGLQSVGAGRAAFLNQMQTVIVPFLGVLLGVEKGLSVRTILSSVLAVVGVSILASDPNPDVISSFTGDLMELCSAFFFSLYILRLTEYSKKTNVPLLVGGKVIVQAVLAWIWALQSITTSQTTVHFIPDGSVQDVLSWAAVVSWTGLVVSALSGWVQTSAQKVVQPSEAAVIFAMQPLIAAALSWILLSENLDAQAATGGVIVVAATIYSSMKPKEEETKEKEA